VLFHEGRSLYPPFEGVLFFKRQIYSLSKVSVGMTDSKFELLAHSYSETVKKFPTVLLFALFAFNVRFIARCLLKCHGFLHLLL
jgi:hypothetical protein